MNKLSKNEKYRLKLLAEFCGKAKRVLDVGLYYPNPYLVESKEFINRSIVGCDIRKSKNPQGYDAFIQGDLQFLDESIAKESFDAIILGEVIEHVKSPYDAIESCYKVLKPGGLLVVSTPNPLGFPRILFEYFSSEKYFYTRRHAFAFIPRWFKRILDSSGFELEKSVGLMHHFPFKIPIWISSYIIYVARKKINHSKNKAYRPAKSKESLEKWLPNKNSK